ncbi:ankyrin repeat-containing domain protein [Microdochium trichocladiopsis]|uniref:Ankyrin repeat-containing domain protein n=1 Tax=Microdochium trichocladiopsis TaxID=1682393 RepID=A0A9P9BMC2_9PEZI|nr:ankyrin repeat-containing domain protein [Microdochium trichocladiopsis]KAH7016285.1 ankyrin repeat-containing domain protein [Microdochium trichocladiopsis]
MNDSQSLALPPSQLMLLPRELLLCILEYLDARSLTQVEKASRDLRDAAKAAFRGVYGPGIHHRQLQSGLPFRELAIEEQLYGCDAFDTEKDIKFLLRVMYNQVPAPTDNDNDHFAAFVLISIRRSRAESTPAWLETAALALMIQTRIEEADAYYERLAAIGPFPPDVALAQARFGSCQRFATTLRNLAKPPTAHLLAKSAVCAAVRGDVDLLKYLCANFSVQLDWAIGDYTTASVAAFGGHINVLEFLHNRGVNIVSPMLRPLPILTAVNCGRQEVVRYLLEKGAPTCHNGLLLAASAISRGFLDILRLISDARTLPNADLAGRLLIGYAVESEIAESRETIIEFLVVEAKLDINALGVGGTALHIAVKSGNIRIVKCLLRLGADPLAKDLLGQAVFEHAVSHNRPVAEWFAEEYGASISKYAVPKARLVAEVMQSWTQNWIYRLADWVQDSVLVSAQDTKFQAVGRAWRAHGMNGKLSSIWLRNLSLTALQWYVGEFRGRDVEKSYLDAAAISFGLTRIRFDD